MRAHLGWVAAVGALLVATTAAGTTMLAMSVDELAQKSDMVVVGRVISTEPRESEDGKRISTLVTLRVDQAWKGRPTEEVRILALGGTLEGISQVVMGAARFEDGEEVVVFLRSLRTAEPLTEVVGMAQGKLSVDRDADGVQVAVPSLRGLELVDRGGREVAPAPLGGPIPLSDLEGKVQAATR